MEEREYTCRVCLKKRSGLVQIIRIHRVYCTAPCHCRFSQEPVQLLSVHLCSSHSTLDKITCESCPGRIQTQHVQMVWVVSGTTIRMINKCRFVSGIMFQKIYCVHTPINFSSAERFVVVSPESRFARWHTTLYNMVNIPYFEMLILVTFGFHMCSHCLFMHIRFFQA